MNFGHFFLVTLSTIFIMGSVLGLITAFLFCWPKEESLSLIRLRRLTNEGDRWLGILTWRSIYERLILNVEPLSRRLYGANINHQNEMRSKLAQAGFPETDAILWRFLATQVLFGIIFASLLATSGFVGFLPFAEAGDIAYQSLMGLVIGAFGGRLIPEIYLKNMASKRQDSIKATLADTVDLLVVCVEAGLGIDATIQRVGDETEVMAPDISKELKRLVLEISAGIPRSEAFHHLARRTGVEDLKTLCNMLIQSERLGTSVADTLRVYSEDNRVRRRQLAEELANKASTKMTFPLVLFIFPPMFIILMGPNLIALFDTFLSK